MNINQWQQKIYALNKEREKLQVLLLKTTGEMIKGTYYLLYKRCGNPACKKCTYGDKHGPFPHISLSQKGKTKITLIRKIDRINVKRKAFNYKLFQSRLARIRKINEQIFEILKQIRDSKTSVYK